LKHEDKEEGGFKVLQHQSC